MDRSSLALLIKITCISMMPDCVIKQAIDAEQINIQRYESYKSICEEMKEN